MEKRNYYIVSPIYDFVFFIGSPVLACIFGLIFLHLFKSGFPNTISLFGHEAPVTGIFALTQAHLVAVFFRSHGNPEIFRQFPVRFTVVPIVLFLLIWLVPWGLAVSAFVVVWWDVYHTSQQNFGLARIYDARSGRPIPQARWLEKIVHLVGYACPILAGSYLMAHVSGFEVFQTVQSTFLGFELPRLIGANVGVIRQAALFIAFATLTIFVIFEIIRYQRGYRYPFPKLLIMGTTLYCTLFAWGFNKFGDAYFIVNLFHAVQYFALVWAMERHKPGTVLFRIEHKLGKILAFLCFFIPPVLLGSWMEFRSSHFSKCLLLTCALLHFWYDGFIWSVRKREV